MSKTLGQVAFEAYLNTEAFRTWEHNTSQLQRDEWERTAQAVVDVAMADKPGILQEDGSIFHEHSATIIAAKKRGYDMGLAQGAAEERGRLAAMFESPKYGHKLEQIPIRDLGLIASWLRAGGKP